jgi:hypothetical protein
LINGVLLGVIIFAMIVRSDWLTHDAKKNAAGKNLLLKKLKAKDF